jgi:phosphotransferase system HPr (HPr) family protein
MALARSALETTVEVKNPEGLHMRPAMQFVDKASQFRSLITVRNGDTEVDAKSIMQMSMLAATCGTKLVIRAEGDDAETAIRTLQELVESRFEM